jgi:hypothetical protein
MGSLQIVMIVCPLMATTPRDCDMAVENPVVFYDDIKKCMTRAQEIHEKTATALYQAGAMLRVGCVQKDFFEQPDQKQDKRISA